MRGLEEQLLAAASALSFPARYRFAWFGKEPARLPPRLARRLDAATIEQHLAHSLTEQLYAHFYCPGHARPVRWLGQAESGVDDAFAARFVAASSGTTRWQSGWRQVVLSGELTVIERQGLRVSARGESLRGVAGGNGAVERRSPAILDRWSKGFLVALGDDPGSDELGRVARFYWNLTPRGGIEFVRRATAGLNAHGIPFQLKILADPKAYARCDAGVLYLRGGDLASARPLVGQLHRDLRGELKAGVPVFAKPLAQGLGFAESPPDGASFGMDRCGLMARGLLEGRRSGPGDPAARLHAIRQAFVAAGLDMERPYRNPRSAEADFELAPGPAETRVFASAQPTASPFLPIEAARIVAKAICAQAIWHDGACNWIVLDDATGGCAALAADLYDGLAGVAMFLAAAGKRLDDPLCTATALGALRSITRYPPDSSSGSPPGFYAGRFGVALACLHAASEVGDLGARGDARRMVDDLAAAGLTEIGNDMLSGWSGTICAALELHRVTGLAALMDLARSGGEALLAQRIQSRSGTSWRTVNKVGEYNLTGFSHGTAGIAHALLLLFEETFDPRLLAAAEDAIRHEQHWFDPHRGNWPDLREASPPRGVARHSRDYSAYWCHGAPGIVLSRLLAYRVTGKTHYLDQARVGLATTLCESGDFARDTIAGLSLCHGLAGNADIALSAARMLTDDGLGADQLCAQAMRGISLLCHELAATPGSHDGLQQQFRNVGLMTGLAGLGWFCLRQHDPELPSILNCLSCDRPI